MDVREKLVELFHQHNAKYVTFCDNCFEDDAEELNDKMLHLSDHLIANGVTVQEWISVDDELPQYTDEYNVTVGVPNELGYFETVTTLRFERIKGKEPRWVLPHNEPCRVIAWMPLPTKYQPPKGE